ncbi:MAG: NAD(P)H-hydrate dehydratase [Vicingaceae bacterium]
MKILSVRSIKEADRYTIENEPIASIDLMERAANKCVEWMVGNIALEGNTVNVFAGTGNNGGDGLAIARMLVMRSIAVNVFIVQFSDNVSDDFSYNLNRLRDLNVEMTYVNSEVLDAYPAKGDVQIDAIFGSGLNKAVSGWLSSVIKKINNLPGIRIAIDIPSGLYADDNAGNNFKNVIKADYTLTFQSPKLAMLSAESGEYFGFWEVLDIGLDTSFISDTDVLGTFIDASYVVPLLKERKKFDHKGSFGHALVMAGSKGKVGAAVLAGNACMTSGIGLLTIYAPECGCDILQISIPEAMVISSSGNIQIQGLPSGVSDYSAIGIGPGLGQGRHIESVLSELFRKYSAPLVLDADALNVMSEKTDLLASMPPKCILTPHPGEFKRLAGEWESDKEKLEKQVEFSRTYDCYLVLKGAHTSISTPEGDLLFNSTGNPGMATAGSGDALLGIITSLLGRGYTSHEAAVLGVYVHGLAGDFAAASVGEESLKATDIITFIPSALQSLYS